ncbi:MAG: DUF2956 domain-containing protein [Vibrio sp.]|uniref:DUF2956 domain-containing protein n=1 Tax=Vibrio sp. TaxID=678 RepID=UPI003A883EC8
MTQKIIPSQQTQQQAMAMAKAVQKPGQTKEQTKLIAQGIEKGIALYKKQQKEKSRQADKARKKVLKTKQSGSEMQNSQQFNDFETVDNTSNRLPWILLAISWIGFIAYWFIY